MTTHSSVDDLVRWHRQHSVILTVITGLALWVTILGMLALGGLIFSGTHGAGFALWAETLLITGVCVLVYLMATPQHLVAGVLRSLGAVELRPSAVPELHAVVEELSIAAGIPKPDLYIIGDPSYNALAVGFRPDDAAIVLTAGLIAAADPHQLRGVLAHELAHIRNRDIVATVQALRAAQLILIAGLSLVILGAFFGAAAGSSGRDDDSGAGGLGVLGYLFGGVLLLLAFPIAAAVGLAVSRRRESMADLTAVQLTGDASTIRSALELIARSPTTRGIDDHAVNALWINSPARIRSWWERIFQTHPPIEERIELLRRIEGTAPGAPPTSPSDR